jgi:hypothetical protein
MEEMNRIKSKKFYNRHSQTITTYNNINNEVCNKMIQTDETSLVPKRQMFTQTVEVFPTIPTGSVVQTSELKEPISRSSTSTSIYGRLTGGDFNKNLHLVSRKLKHFDKDNNGSEEIKSDKKSYSNRNLSYEKANFDNYFKSKLS